MEDPLIFLKGMLQRMLWTCLVKRLELSQPSGFILCVGGTEELGFVREDQF
jgi:hypothetical protein